ncbi:outer membrane usher protein [Enterobacter cloacae]|uniref:outer membrane usher protein n=1 Tax=Enterobacter cloacae TaxID=550 RepID=UPI0013EF5D94|nr:outer membrane usher protein [Enterobacter cloacae]
MLFQRSLLCIAICAAFPLYASENGIKNAESPSESESAIEFNDQFLIDNGGGINVERYAYGNPVLPGTYRVKVNLNGTPKSTVEMTFIDNKTPRASACLTKVILSQSGIDTRVLVDEYQDNEDACVDIKKYYPDASANFDSNRQEMDLHFPQIYVLKLPAGYVDPSLWDNGVPAGILSYDLNTWHSESGSANTDTAYAGLHYGLNMGPWRLRSRGSLNWDSENGSHYSSQDIYLQRDITPLRAQLVMGDSFTRGDIFDAVNLSGARMYNDDRMLPQGSTGYAPVIRGVANSNAKVTVIQSGNKIYETTVPPGAFEINDLSTTGYGNDLIVTVEEADGSKRTFTVPFSSVTQMLRPGSSRWDIGLGELNDDSLRDKPNVGYATYSYGLSNTFTGYVGAQYTDMDFYAGLLGLAMNTEMGAFAADVTQSYADIEGLDTLKGQSYRLTYSKMLEATNTSLNVAAYRFSTEDYLSLNDAASLQDSIHHQEYGNRSYDSNAQLYADYQRTKNQVQISLNQPLQINGDDHGSLYVSGTWQDYWNDSSSTSDYSVGYNNSFAYGSYSISVQRTYDESGEKDDSVYVNVSIPFSLFDKEGAQAGGFNNVNMSLRSDFKGGTSFNSTASGNAKNNDMSYSVSASSNGGNYGNLNQVSGYSSWNSPYGPLGLSASFGDDNSKQYSASYNGGMIVHTGGVVFTPGSIGETDSLALVKASGATGARLGYGQSRINSSGYGIMPYMSAYRENRVSLDISTLETDVEIKSTSAVAVPRNGSVVLVNFETDEGRSLVLELQRSDKGFIPLGADVLNEKNEPIGTVGQAGQAYVRGVDEKGTLRVVWGNDSASNCTVHYQIPANAKKAGLTTILNGQQCQM